MSKETMDKNMPSEESGSTQSSGSIREGISPACTQSPATTQMHPSEEESSSFDASEMGNDQATKIKEPMPSDNTRLPASNMGTLSTAIPSPPPPGFDQKEEEETGQSEGGPNEAPQFNSSGSAVEPTDERQEDKAEEEKQSHAIEDLKTTEKTHPSTLVVNEQVNVDDGVETAKESSQQSDAPAEKQDKEKSNLQGVASTVSVAVPAPSQSTFETQLVGLNVEVTTEENNDIYAISETKNIESAEKEKEREHGPPPPAPVPERKAAQLANKRSRILAEMQGSSPDTKRRSTRLTPKSAVEEENTEFEASLDAVTAVKKILGGDMGAVIDVLGMGKTKSHAARTSRAEMAVTSLAHGDDGSLIENYRSLSDDEQGKFEYI